ncbi:MAG TPA: hypothetical protein VGH38_03775 [Bryobacteraceae bacterium]|jgi:probable HAF family extracellular repeat protein
MKRSVTLIAAGSLLAAFALAQPGKRGYTVTDLGNLGNVPPGQQFFISANGLIAGATSPDGTAMHATVWYKGQSVDLGKAGVGRPNSAALGINDRGQVVGQADTIIANSEDFCAFNANGFKSSTACMPFLWQNGVMRPLPTLGGANGVANLINNRGQVAGWAQAGGPGAACPVGLFYPVVWQNGGVRQLPIGAGDNSGLAAAINDNGQIVGASGTCSAYIPGPGVYLLEKHAMMWDSDGTPHDLGNLGGSGGFAGNHACALNNLGQVVGHALLTNDYAGPFHAFLWTGAKGMQDLGALAGEHLSLALGINDRTQIVGSSLSDDFSAFTAVLWENGAITDLNTLVTANPAGLYLIFAESINSAGEIVGYGAAADGIHAFVATPNNGQNLSAAAQSASRPVLTGPARETVIRRLGIRLP